MPLTLTITISLDNDAVAAYGAEEVARLLHTLAQRIIDRDLALDGTDTFPPLLDINGNTVGSVDVSED